MDMIKTKPLIALAAFLVAASAGCDQDSNTTPSDTTVDGDVPADTWADTEPGDTSEDTEPGDTTPDGEDVVEDAPITIPEPGTHRDSMVVDGVTRTYAMFVPASACASMASGRVPFLIGLHGAGDTGENFITAVRLTDLATTNAFVVAGPDGFNHGWFVEGAEGWPGADGHSTSLENDTDYVQALIDLGYESYGIDRSRVYVVGHSRGAGMTGLLATQSGVMTTSAGPYTSPFAAYCVNAGYDAYGGSFDLTRSTPKRPIWVIHGTSDSVVPYSYGESFATALEAAGWDVTWTSVTGGTHTWLFQSGYGQTNQDMWDFFIAHSI
jgi:poly(3-hydroxybutyrate) depolymerase